MKRARVVWMGAIHDATEANGLPQLADGRILAENDVVWLPPLQPTERPRTIFALGLNYTDHTKELAFKAPDEPLIFLKGSNTLIGHRGQTHRPADATYMHYECELAVVIGRTARRVTRADAYDYVAGSVQLAAQEVGEILSLPAVEAAAGSHHDSRSSSARRAAMPRAV